MNRGFIKVLRGVITEELLRKDHGAFCLLIAIGLRARWSHGRSEDGLDFGQAFIGDYRECGLTEKRYRGAKRRLELRGLVRFKGTRRGTVATIVDRQVVDLVDARSLKVFKGGPRAEKSPQRGGLHDGHNTGSGSAGGSQRNAGFFHAETLGVMADHRAHKVVNRDRSGATNQNEEGNLQKLIQRRGSEPCFFALCEIDGANPAEITKPKENEIAAALASIRQISADLTPSEIRRRATEYRKRMPKGCRITAHALAKHWANCTPGAGVAIPEGGDVSPEPEGWQTWVRENCANTDLANEAWPKLDRTQREYIKGAMASADKGASDESGA